MPDLQSSKSLLHTVGVHFRSYSEPQVIWQPARADAETK